MDRNRYRRIAVRATAVIGLLFTLVAVLFLGEFCRIRNEMNAVLSDLFAVVLNKIPDLGSGRSFRIIIMSEAQLPGTGPWRETRGEEIRARWSLLSDEKLRFPQASLITR